VGYWLVVGENRAMGYFLLWEKCEFKDFVQI
jgi:hypothetical protein